MTLAKTVDGAYSLTDTATAKTSFRALVGNLPVLASVTTDAAGSTAINGGSVATTGTQTYNDDVTLGAGTTLSSSGAGAAGNITLANTANGEQTLTVKTARTTDFGGTVGNRTASASVTTDAAGSTAI